MTVQSLGSQPLATLNPGLVLAGAGLSASAAALIPQLTANLAGAVMASAQIALFPPSLSVQLSDAIAAVTSIGIAIGAGVPPVDVQLVSIATGIAEVTAQIGALEAQVSVIAELNAALNAAVAAYVFDGATQDLGTALRFATANGVQGAGGGTPTNALVLATTLPASVGTMLDVFGVSAVPPGKLTLLGEKSLSSFSPILADVLGQLSGNIAGNLPGLYAQIDGMLSAQLNLTLNPPTLLTQLAFASQLVVTLTALIAGPGVPAFSAQFDALGVAIAGLTDLVAELNAQVSFATGLADDLTATVSGFFFDGPARDCGPELGVAISPGIESGGPSTPMTAIVLATSQPVSASAMSTLFGVAA